MALKDLLPETMNQETVMAAVSPVTQYLFDNAQENKGDMRAIVMEMRDLDHHQLKALLAISLAVTVQNAAIFVAGMMAHDVMHGEEPDRAHALVALITKIVDQTGGEGAQVIHRHEGGPMVPGNGTMH